MILGEGLFSCETSPAKGDVAELLLNEENLGSPNVVPEKPFLDELKKLKTNRGKKKKKSY